MVTLWVTILIYMTIYSKKNYEEIIFDFHIKFDGIFWI